jgi:hypothetical protein
MGLIYVASPIDFVEGYNTNSFFGIIKKSFPEKDVFIPAEHWNGDKETSLSEKHRINWRKLKESETVFCLLLNETVGCFIELGYAISEKKQIIMVSEYGKYQKSTTLKNLPFENIHHVKVEDFNEGALRSCLEVNYG